ncbi:MAG: hypothetical protein ACO3HT_07595, partial [Ilumatobacteraceae bacterium]
KELDEESDTASKELDEESDTASKELDEESDTASNELDESDEHPTAAKSIAVIEKTCQNFRISPPIDEIGISVAPV